MTLQTNSVMLSDQLVAVPLFIFMGIVMEQAGLMERLFQAVQMMMSTHARGAVHRGPVRVHHLCGCHGDRRRVRNDPWYHGGADDEPFGL